MAVYEQTYKRFEGALTPEWSRFLVLPRYAFRDVFKARMFLVFFVLCFMAPFAGLILIYLHHNLSALKVLGMGLAEIQNAIPIDETFFFRGLGLQGFLAFVLVLTVGPALVAPDLRNNGLALYLSRPFSRAEYVLGKGFVLVALLSLITWIPGLLLFFFQSYLDGAGWMGEHLGLGWAIFAGSWVWILFLTLLALAVSAWVKWKPVARVALMVIFFVLRGFAAALNHALDTRWGMLLSASDVINSIWGSLFHQDLRLEALPVGPAWVSWAAGCLVCLWLLSRRLRAYEVVR
jgi:ABC-2 type transport system permease protein